MPVSYKFDEVLPLTVVEASRLATYGEAECLQMLHCVPMGKGRLLETFFKKNLVGPEFQRVLCGDAAVQQAQ